MPTAAQQEEEGDQDGVSAAQAGCRLALLLLPLSQRPPQHTWPPLRQQRQQHLWALQRQHQEAWTASSCSSCCTIWLVWLKRLPSQSQQQQLPLLPLLPPAPRLHHQLLLLLLAGRRQHSSRLPDSSVVALLLVLVLPTLLLLLQVLAPQGLVHSLLVSSHSRMLPPQGLMMMTRLTAASPLLLLGLIQAFSRRVVQQLQGLPLQRQSQQAAGACHPLLSLAVAVVSQRRNTGLCHRLQQQRVLLLLSFPTARRDLRVAVVAAVLWGAQAVRASCCLQGHQHCSAHSPLVKWAGGLPLGP